MPKTQDTLMENRRILVIDDNRAIHDDFRKILSSSKDSNRNLASLKNELFGEDETKVADIEYDLSFASQGQEAFEIVKRGKEENTPFALAFVDMRMPPGWDGLETIQKLWSLDPRIEAVICTAYSDYSLDEIAEKLTRVDRYVILKKPFEMMEARQLALSLTQKWNHARMAEKKMGELEELVKLRTQALTESNEALKMEMDRREKTEQELIRSERMAAVGTLAAGVAHEFNNINAVILGYVQLLQNDPSVPDDIKSKLGLLASSAKRACSITQRLMLFTRPKAPQRAKRYLKDIINDITEIVRNEYTAEGIQINCQLDDSLDAVFSEELDQVFLNLLINARHALVDRKEKRITIETGSSGNQIYARVRDTGCGIPSDNLTKIFTPFFSTKGEHSKGQTPQSNIKGSGLGLSVCGTIVRECGGYIETESVVDEGTTFTLLFPKTGADINADEPVKTKLDNQACPNKSIFIVDNDPKVISFIHETLSKQGNRIDSADNAQDALSKLAENKYDVIMCNLQMPDDKGGKLLHSIQGEQVNAAAKVIVLTGERESPDSIPNKAITRIDGILEKPIHVDELVRSVWDAFIQN